MPGSRTRGPRLLGGIAIAITDRVQAEEALRRADRRKDEFLATLSPELRNPLAPIRNALHILRQTGPGEPADRVHEMLDHQLARLIRLVDDLLEVSRISGGRLDLRKEPVDLASVVPSAIETSAPLIERAARRADRGEERGAESGQRVHRQDPRARRPAAVTPSGPSHGCRSDVDASAQYSGGR